jgi:hypothetical protein
MGIRTPKAHGHIGMAGSLDLPAGKHPAALGINQKREKHGWRILLTAGAPMIDLSHGCIQRLDGIDHEMDEMVAWNPVSHVRGKHGSIAVDVDDILPYQIAQKELGKLKALSPTGCNAMENFFSLFFDFWLSSAVDCGGFNV